MSCIVSRYPVSMCLVLYLSILYLCMSCIVSRYPISMYVSCIVSRYPISMYVSCIVTKYPISMYMPCIVTKAVSTLRYGLMQITANPGRSGSKPIESRPDWCTNTHTHSAVPRAKHVTIQKWRHRRACFVHRQLSKFPIDILSLARSSQPWYSICMSYVHVYVCTCSRQ